LISTLDKHPWCLLQNRTFGQVLQHRARPSQRLDLVRCNRRKRLLSCRCQVKSCSAGTSYRTPVGKRHDRRSLPLLQAGPFGTTTEALRTCPDRVLGRRHVRRLYVERETGINLYAVPNGLRLLDSVQAMLSKHTVAVPGLILATAEGRGRATEAMIRLLRGA